jgi:hypothetical protein
MSIAIFLLISLFKRKTTSNISCLISIFYFYNKTILYHQIKILMVTKNMTPTTKHSATTISILISCTRLLARNGCCTKSTNTSLFIRKITISKKTNTILISDYFKTLLTENSAFVIIVHHQNLVDI